MVRFFINIAAACVLLSCTSQIPNISDQRPITNLEHLRDQIDDLCTDPNLFNASIGVYIESLESGEIIYRNNEHKLFIPASNMKLFTTAVALLKFGPSFKYQTRFYAQGSVSQGVLNGNLIVRGCGDPTISSRHANGDVRTILSAWVDSLKERGISEIAGNLIGDVSYFQNTPLGNGWEWDDEPYGYAAQMSALSLNDNCVDISVFPNEKIGFPPYVEISPPTEYVQVRNTARTVVPDSIRSLHVTRQRMENVILIENELPLNFNSYRESISVDNPGMFFMTVLREVFAAHDITVRGDLDIIEKADREIYTTTQKLFSHYSPPLSEIVEVINKKSQNLYAEQLLLTLAAEYGSEAKSSAGAKVILSRLNAMGIPESEFIMYDGSGLSRKSLISPIATATLLRYMAKHTNFEYMFSSLPVSGVDGTLSYRMRHSAAMGNVVAKTGYVSHVRNLSGYARSADNEMFIFSILINHYTLPTPAINLLQDRICERLCSFSRS